MVIKKLNSVFSKHSRLLFGIFALLIIVAFTPGIIGGCDQNPANQTAGTAFGEKVTYSDLSAFARKFSVALMLLSDGRMAQMPENDALFQMYCMEKYAGRIGLAVSDKEVADEIKNLPAAQKDGKFDIAKFDNFLKEYRLSDEEADAAVRLIVVMKKFDSMTKVSGNVSDQEAETFYRMNHNQYTLNICQIDPAKFKVAPPKKAELQKYYSANKGKFMKDKKQLTFDQVLLEVRKAVVTELQQEQAVKFARDYDQKLRKMEDRKAAGKAFAELKKYGTFTTVTLPDEKIMQDMNKFMLVYPLMNRLPELYTGDIVAFMASNGPAFAMVVKRDPSDMSKFAAAKDQIKMQLSMFKSAQANQRIMNEISRQCTSNIPQKGQAE